MLKEIRFILIFSGVLSLIEIFPLAYYGVFSEPAYLFTGVLSVIVSVLFILAFSEEYKNRVAFYLLGMSVFLYLFVLPISYIKWTLASECFIILEALITGSVGFFVIVSFIADVFDRDIIFLEKAEHFLFKKSNAFYDFISGGRHAEKLQGKNC